MDISELQARCIKYDMKKEFPDISIRIKNERLHFSWLENSTNSIKIKEYLQRIFPQFSFYFLREKGKLNAYVNFAQFHGLERIK